PSEGDVLFGGVPVTDFASHERDVSMVFQDNALIPFKSVRKNVSFPLELHHVKADEIEDRVNAESRAMAIERFLSRMPAQLAAGHQQLVQAARALVRRPRVLLLDEPLARVDPVQRSHMRGELKLLQRGYGVTTLYATNDPVEAMTLGDRIAVLDRGRIRQIGPPQEVYADPADRFVAEFVGTAPMSFLRGRVVESEVRMASGALPVPAGTPQGDVNVGVRPHEWELTDTAGLSGVVRSAEFQGDRVMASVDLSGDVVIARFDGLIPSVGESIQMWTRRFHLFLPNGRSIARITNV
nr:ABC transporter ATP-binding protein [Acidimicrobiia bacterium]